MVLWEQFEDDCFDYLEQNYSINGTTFVKHGKADSTLPDIKVKKSDGTCFFIEVKDSPSQCGQFVLIPDIEKKIFVYSRQNKTNLNNYSKTIIDYMNTNYKFYVEAGTTGLNINLPKIVFYKWILDYYYSKNVKFFITRGNCFTILPLEKFCNYFDVSAKYRMKKSGSANPSKCNQTEVIKLLQNSGCEFSSSQEGKSLYIKTTENLANTKVSGDKYDFLFVDKGNGNYKVRQLSNTCNSNVIFSITLKSEQDINDLGIFEKQIK